jgi:hypothetical protein
VPADVDVLTRLLGSMNDRPRKVKAQLRESRRYEFGRVDWMDLLWSYYTGEPPLPKLSQGWADATREFLRLARANYSLLVVDAMLDRLTLRGGRTAEDSDSDGDGRIRRFHSENGSYFADALAYAFAMGEGFVFVGPPAKGSGSTIALATAEDPRQVAVDPDPARPSVLRSAVKTYRDGGEVWAHLYRPADEDGDNDRVTVFAREARKTRGGWETQESKSGPLDVQGFGVPVVPLTNRFGKGEFELHLDLIDRINDMIANRLWVAKFQAFRQRAVKGDLPEEDDEGNKINYDKLFAADPGALWELPEGVDIWESQLVDMQQILASVRDDVKELAATSRTPLFMFTPDAAAGSAEGASLMREGIVFKTEDRQDRMTPAANRVYKLGLAYSGEEQAARGEISPIWGPAERYSLQQRGSAAVQAKASGVPQESIWTEVWQFDPPTVARMEQQRATDLLFQQPGEQGVSAASLATQAAGQQPPPPRQQPPDQPQPPRQQPPRQVA